MRIIARLNVGGPALQVILLHDRLGPPDFDNLLVCGQIDPHEGDMRYLADERGITPVIIPNLGRSISPIRDVLTILRLYRMMRQYKPHVVDTHTAKAGFVGRVAAWLARVPVRVHTFHGHVFHGYFGNMKTRVFLQLERWCARISTRIITVSPILRDQLVETYRIAPIEKFVVMPNGLDLERFALPIPVSIEETYQLPTDVKLIGIIGRLTSIKNHALFLEAAHLIRQARQDVHFVIVGDGELRPNLEHQVKKLGLESYVSFIGWVKDPAPLLQNFDVFALTSNNEGTPFTIMEAMAAGISVVSTNVGGVADMLEDGRLGTLVSPHDPKAFAEAVLQVLDGHHPDVLIAQSVALDTYSIGALVRDLGALYHQLLRERPVINS